MSVTQGAPEAMVTAYLICALWAEVDERGEPLDSQYGLSDIAAPALQQAQQECAQFCAQAERLLAESGMSAEQAGHDFWLTRNHHGAGFWDRGLPRRLGEALTMAAQTFGSCEAYVGDDGQVWLTGVQP